MQASPSPSGRHLVTGVGDHLLTWSLDPDAWAEIACRAAGRTLTEEEWAEFVGDEPYDPVCA